MRGPGRGDEWEKAEANRGLSYYCKLCITVHLASVPSGEATAGRLQHL